MLLFLYWLYSIILLCFLYIKIHSFCTYIQTCYISVQYTCLPSWEVAPERNLTSFKSWLSMYITLHLIGCFWIELHRLLFVTKTSNETSFILLLISPLLLFSISLCFKSLFWFLSLPLWLCFFLLLHFINNRNFPSVSVFCRIDLFADLLKSCLSWMLPILSIKHFPNDSSSPMLNYLDSHLKKKKYFIKSQPKERFINQLNGC